MFIWWFLLGLGIVLWKCRSFGKCVGIGVIWSVLLWVFGKWVFLLFDRRRCWFLMSGCVCILCFLGG